MSFPHKLSISSQSGPIADAVFRVVIAFDTNDYSLLESAMDKDAIFEMDGTVYDKHMKKDIFDFVGPMDTTHSVSNIRVDHKEGDLTAYLTGHAVAQHCAPGTGNIPDSPKFLAGSMYFIDLSLDKEAGLWKITKWVMKIVWRQGDASVMQRSE